MHFRPGSLFFGSGVFVFGFLVLSRALPLIAELVDSSFRLSKPSRQQNGEQ